MDEDFELLLKQHSLSSTRSRRAVFRTFATANRALSMRELIEICSDIDRVSVYRIVEVFERIGALARIQHGWKYRLELGDMFKKHHHHLTCVGCGKTVDFDEPAWLDDEVNSLAKKHGFSIQQHSFELRGLCATCQAQSSSTP